jgi:hypothetical protein
VLKGDAEQETPAVNTNYLKLAKATAEMIEGE